MALPKITCATGDRYDTRYLMNGTVTIDGFDVDYPNRGDTPGLFFPEVLHAKFDVGEQAFAHYLISVDQGMPLSALPVFPSRFFPQIGASVRKGAGIETPRDLIGKRVAAPDFAYNPAVWLRGILAHQYEVPLDRVIWVESAVHPLFPDMAYPRSRRFEIEELPIPAGDAHDRPENYGIFAALEADKIDAVFLPSGGRDATGLTDKLFPDPEPEIRAYVADTGIFPINTVMTVHLDTIARHPDLPRAMMDGFNAAMALYHRDIAKGDAPVHMHLDTALLDELGVFPPVYGLEQNLAAVRMMIQYCYEQGLIRRLYAPEELFLPGF